MTAGAYAHPHLPRPEAMSLSVPLEVSDNEKGVQLRRLNALLRVGMAPAAGLEPATKWLTATYSTAELRRIMEVTARAVTSA